MEKQKNNRNLLSQDYTQSKAEADGRNTERASLTCPNCGSELESRKCKLLCTRVGCGYMVTCSEW